MAGHRLIARIARATGLAGQVLACPIDGAPFCPREGLSLWIVPPEQGLPRATSVSKLVAREGGALLVLEGVDNRDVAERLVGRYLLAAAEDVAEGEQTEPTKPAALGCTLLDAERGALGTIVEERVGAAQTLWVVDGPFGNVLIPAVDDFIEGRDGETIRVVLPPGLLELNR
ncbi:MAG: hypothetical protein LBH64_02700 [Coriobacteriales bacterium]|jgi:16S rRNA processing protein RimM|nr:hypothetical protein [Coriobacteriales bacterium]